MLISAFSLGEDLKLRDLVYHPFAGHWGRYDLTGLDLSFDRWTTIKYLNDAGDGFSDEIGQLPNDAGGLYLYSVRCPIVPGMSHYPVYIGRALMTEHESLRARCRSYFTTYSRNDERPLIHRMFKYWGKELYLSFYPLADNAMTIEYEKQLVNALLLPCNDAYMDIEVRQARKAFGL